MRINAFQPSVPSAAQSGGFAGSIAGAMNQAQQYQQQIGKTIEQGGLAQTATGIGQQEMAKGAISPQMVQAQLALAQQHANIASQNTNQAVIATNVAAKTMNAHIAQQQALNAQAQQKAQLMAEITKMYPGLTNAEKVQMVTGMESTLLKHPVQRIAGAVPTAQSATNSVLSGATSNTNKNPPALNSSYFIKNPSAWVPYVSQSYDTKYGKGSWSKASVNERKKFGDQLGQSMGLS